MLLETQCGDWAKVRSVNSSSANFPSKIPTPTEPTGDAGTAAGASVINLGLPTGGGSVQNALIVMPYGLGSDDDAFSMRIIGWGVIGRGVPATWLWVPTIIVELGCIISTAVGVAGMQVLNTERFADTITLVTGNDDISIDIVSPTGNVCAHAVVDLKGFQKIEFTFDQTTGTPTMNALYRLL